MFSNLLQHFHRKFIICILILFVLECKQANAAALKSGDSDQHCGGITSTQSCVFSYRTVEFGRFRSIVFLLLCCLLQPPYPLLHIFSIPPRWLFLRARWIPHFSPSELSLLHTQQRLALKMRLSRTWDLADSYVWNNLVEMEIQSVTVRLHLMLCSMQPRVATQGARMWTGLGVHGGAVVNHCTWCWVAILWRSATARCRWRERFT